MTVAHCEIRRRLTPDPDLEDFWWAYDDGARQELVVTLETRGLSFFSEFESFPDYWQSISIEDLRMGTFARKMPGMTRVRAALLLARLHAFLGDWVKAHDLAKYGLEVVPTIATGPKRAFKALLAQRSG